ncbi:unnamed protein product [Cyclocybe aegerita]|uniref:Uncharacterized protein n=1 Tax=Cyclocybe aegerita TaxID=1973307 RepID=A0A8S0WJR4_CYCAE|nr:unnamed protein product [Cyclocybe aegerita]
MARTPEPFTATKRDASESPPGQHDPKRSRPTSDDSDQEMEQLMDNVELDEEDDYYDEEETPAKKKKVIVIYEDDEEEEDNENDLGGYQEPSSQKIKPKTAATSAGLRSKVSAKPVSKAPNPESYGQVLKASRCTSEDKNIEVEAAEDPAKLPLVEAILECSGASTAPSCHPKPRMISHTNDDSSDSGMDVDHQEGVQEKQKKKAKAPAKPVDKGKGPAVPKSKSKSKSKPRPEPIISQAVANILPMGSSRAVGGFSRGNALGNAPNLADMGGSSGLAQTDVLAVTAPPCPGIIYVYHQRDTPQPQSIKNISPSWFIKVNLNLTLGKILEKVRDCDEHIQNDRVFIWDDKYGWEAYGPFKQAIISTDIIEPRELEEGGLGISLLAALDVSINRLDLLGRGSTSRSPSVSSSIAGNVSRPSSPLASSFSVYEEELINKLEVDRALLQSGKKGSPSDFDLRKAWRIFNFVESSALRVKELELSKRPTQKDLQDLFVQKTQYNSYQKVFRTVAKSFEEMKDWLDEEGADAEENERVWGEDRVKYSLTDLIKWVENEGEPIFKGEEEQEPEPVATKKRAKGTPKASGVEILDVPYFDPKGLKITQEALEKALRTSVHAEVFTYLSTKPQIDRNSAHSTSCTVYCNIWDSQQGTHAKKALGQPIFLAGRSCAIRPAARHTGVPLCQRCWKWGHPTVACKAKQLSCPICSGPHKQKEHRQHAGCCKGNAKAKPPVPPTPRNQPCPQK